MASRKLNILLPIVFGLFMFFFDFLLSQFGPTRFSVRIIIWAIIQATATYWIIYFFTSKWIRTGSEKFVLTFFKSLLALIIAVLLINVLYLLYRYVYPSEVYTSSFRPYVLSIASILTFFEGILFLFILQTIYYFSEKTRLKVEQERLQEENIRAQFELLKTEINPHYLFNNFNTLYGLIQEDKKMASDFLLNLSQLYRYILSTRERDTVSFREELKMVKSYIHVLEERYRDQLTVEYILEDRLFSYHIVPMGLQMLIENAIKHNQIDEAHCLKISIRSGEQAIIVENNLNARKYPVESTGKGLENLRKRYEIITDSPVRINISDDEFRVELPLIESPDESVNN